MLGPAPYIFIVTDEYSRYPFAFPCKDLSTATVIRSLTQLFVLFGLPMYVHSDRGAAFMARDLRNYLVKRGLAASRSTPYHPTGNSQIERTNKTIWKTVQLMVCDLQIPVERWQDVLPDALHAVRSLLCTSTNSTPHERFFGFERRSMLGKSLSSWLLQKGPVLLRRFVRNKDEPLVDEVDLLDANPSFAHIRFPDGRESTVSTTDLAPCPRTTASEPSSELTNNLPATGTTAEVENSQKPLEQTDKHDLNGYKMTLLILATRVYVDRNASVNSQRDIKIPYLTN